MLTLGEYDKGINDLSGGHSHRSRYTAARDALEARFSGRILFVSDDVVRRGGRISGAVKRDTGHLPSVVDTILAATVIEHELFLVTRNVRDVQLNGATISNP